MSLRDRREKRGERERQRGVGVLPLQRRERESFSLVRTSAIWAVDPVPRGSSYFLAFHARIMALGVL